ncbi:MAG TPA: hypothetical protein DIT81_04480 [Alistipes obesi]|nr:hypothetical protein [Alistipes communis]
MGRAKVNKNSDFRQIFPSKNAGGGENGFGRCAATAVRNDESDPAGPDSHGRSQSSGIMSESVIYRPLRSS